MRDKFRPECSCQKGLPSTWEALGSIRVAVKNQWAAYIEVLALLTWLGSRVSKSVNQAELLGGSFSERYVRRPLCFNWKKQA